MLLNLTAEMRVGGGSSETSASRIFRALGYRVEAEDGGNYSLLCRQGAYNSFTFSVSIGFTCTTSSGGRRAPQPDVDAIGGHHNALAENYIIAAANHTTLSEHFARLHHFYLH
jgi:hypothetical protein